MTASVQRAGHLGSVPNLTNRDDQKDFTVRMKQFFDHYLQGKAAPQWMTDGLP